MKKTLSILFFCAANLLYAQQITNVRFEQVGETVAVRYDITDSEDWHLFEITLHLSTDGGKTYSNALRQVSGDAGRGIKGGYGKQITWRAVEEVKTLTGSAIRFKVEALQYGTSPVPEGFVFIKGGTFLMGSNENDDEKPIHSVTVSSFYMGKYEVTQKQWRDIMGNDPSYFKNCDNCPVEQVSWDDIQDFLRKLNAQTGKNYRLPTEAEWEYACRAGTTTTFNTGDNLTTAQANYYGDYPRKNYPKGEYREKTTLVGSFAPNAWGLYDMHGNVWEWCSDWYGLDYYKNSPSNNPKGPSSGANRVLRSGSWDYYAGGCRSALRYSSTPSYRGNGFSSYGFRLAL